jgi:anti-sigma B factor antagonist
LSSHEIQSNNSEISMEIKIIHQLPKARVVTVSGRVDGATAPVLENELMKLLGLDVDLILDLTQLEWISSAGWWVLINTKKALDKNKHYFIITNLPNKIFQSLELTGMANFFIITESVEQSIDTLKAGSKFQLPKTKQKEKTFRILAYHPTRLEINDWHTLSIECFESRLQSKLVQLPNESSPVTFDQLPTPILMKLGTKIRLVPSCKGIIFNPDYLLFRVEEEYHRVDFRFRIESSLFEKDSYIVLTVLANDILTGTITIPLYFTTE